MAKKLDTLRRQYPDFNWPAKGKKRRYPEDLGAVIGDIRLFGFPPRRYKIVFRTSSEKEAKEYAGKHVSGNKNCKAQITYNPIRLETYGVWIQPYD